MTGEEEQLPVEKLGNALKSDGRRLSKAQSRKYKTVAKEKQRQKIK